MSTNLEYLLQLHRNGVITDDDLQKGIRILKEPSEAPTKVPSPPKTEVPSIQTENKRAKRNKKKKEKKRLKKKYEQLQKAVIDELKQVLSQREKRKSVSELKLVDKPLCNYFKTYEIDANTYKDLSALFSDKKSMLVNQISQDLREYNGIKFSIGLSVQFYHDEGDGERKLVVGQNHGEQSAVLDENNVDEFYDKQTAYLQTWIEKFTNTASGLEIDHCIKLYLNIAKYEPLKGSSKIPLPEALANKKAIINLPNEDDRCLEWALLSILYYNENNPSKLSSYRKNLGTLHLKGIDFPTPLSQIPKVEKQNADFAINVYGYSVSPKKQKIRVFPYYIFDRPQKIPRANLLMISEDVEVNYSNDDGITDKSYDPDESMVDENYDPADYEDYPEQKKKETKYHYCGITKLDRLLFDQNKHKTKTYFCDRCLYGFTKEDLLIKHKEDCCGINTNSTRIDMPPEGSKTIKTKCLFHMSFMLTSKV